jgi:hypothetical protein
MSSLTSIINNFQILPNVTKGVISMNSFTNGYLEGGFTTNYYGVVVPTSNYYVISLQITLKSIIPIPFGTSICFTIIASNGTTERTINKLYANFNPNTVDYYSTFNITVNKYLNSGETIFVVFKTSMNDYAILLSGTEYTFLNVY